MKLTSAQPDVTRQLSTHSPEETWELGVRLGRVLEPGDFVGLIGDLGAGKTHFVRGVADGAEVDRSQVASPTFAIVYPYEGGRIPLYHADLYRLADYDDLYGTGFLDLVGTDAALLVEWLDNVPEAAPPQRLVIRIAHPDRAGADERVFVVEAYGARPAALLNAWLGAE